MRTHCTDRILAIDTEWTCWEGGAPPGMRSEILEIGIVEADVATLEILREESWLVRPAYSEVSGYCERLTGIAGDEARRFGRPLPEVMRTLTKQFGPSRKALVSWGDDLGGIEAECRAFGVENPFRRELAVDFGLVHALSAGCRERPSLDAALAAEGVPFEGRRHRALPDALATMRLFLAFAARQRPGLSPGAVP
ncbi:3'-5' exonuclease [Methylorubrum extorquens]|uniref:Exonuclease domain-containing protein n=1 Tax=Methylorubrum extorquens (strain ATCC 14718 / DSM 1338 / JCM 2805 / NCIMB 9133 / AM1) TaxID=272630 RepID=C5B5B3_METEA|nr:3'-5' exonuclease [Methylorubrum extorquens]ACS43645.1 conserved hypothetical protein [Methylorubrum extorquens AM1]MCP1546551.1 inhibitor of KinA sporulation pathway (predicted exonuclease) [Methylorubrum extorquens]MCP1591218.1 inhibitor of KinA sporulation pathway (predicted exonuclease) [Methylorubrum extorquens]